MKLAFGERDPGKWRWTARRMTARGHARTVPGARLRPSMAEDGPLTVIRRAVDVAEMKPAQATAIRDNTKAGRSICTADV